MASWLAGPGDDPWSRPLFAADEEDAGGGGRRDASECHEVNGIGAHRFKGADYAVFAAILSISIFIGLYVGFFRGRIRTASAFLVGNRSMHFLPVALSMILGHSSAVVMLGNPAEMYNYGVLLYVLSFAFLVGGPLATALFLPVYENLRITSVNELMSNGLVLYAPSLALAQVTNMNVYVIVGIVFGVCVFYASVGGIKAIVWSDTLMFVILLVTMAALIIRGTGLDGGVATVWSDSLQTGRLEMFRNDPSIAERYTFWSVFFGGIFYWVGLTAMNQASVQRLLTMPNYKEATKLTGGVGGHFALIRNSRIHRCIWLTAVGNIVISSALFYLGMMLYSSYKHCDPISAKMIKRSDQLLPLYVMDVMHSFPGVPGLFVASIFSTSIGSVAAMLNGMAAVTLRDFIIGVLHRDLTDIQAGTISKILSFCYGIASVAFLVVMSRTGSMVEVVNYSSQRGHFWGTSVAVHDGRIVYDLLPISVDGCLCNATIAAPKSASGPVLPIFLISTMWYSPIGFVIFLIASIILSGITGFQDPRDLDQSLLSPVAKWLFNKLPPSVRTRLRLPIYESQEREMTSTIDDGVSKKKKKTYDIRL
ncbi:sodium-coupled monocarboxylate transporter 2-like [Hetaerina americana]|uniref:sodium-coupled monocarboxylate transporter 2-like n=1 Tax=Hetaerina americana TaxID=62018 RepID=UPI003A7F12FB